MYHLLQLMKDISFLKKYNQIFIEGNKNCKFITISSIKYKFRNWAKRLRVGGRNDSHNRVQNDSGGETTQGETTQGERKVGETSRYLADNVQKDI